ncbi:glycosyltransferase family 2 protein [Rodentibacter pneumotropicus]|uniref:glycosyltransferase family 2 protein n=1 Tax=Rodentibacter pneumotropicus TaxID=758 RepID=UPI0003613817|nr:glycosyltransferase family 2 protein [Rodentibacter pneumotropicus]NBH75782.1 glycosyltransferase family 2 protein [Rodentibacter pneumotropicus]OOF61046.1 glycosyltransferase [Rodentibacter pneumotropicus]THA02101.1 glycosyltransferase family 2 protein [Rodentibacter pneumotropicus]THA06385.1 glycosyltransferase family 2 protein [Rodentibacter pneumotropicus]THA13527.1 glycosyltransferase family 2 protein [Rodentibacter pneumotropicus]
MFSIIVPSYNRKSEIPALLESLNHQTNKDFEVVIIDDNSQDPVVVEKFYPFKVNVIRNETNQGAAESRNIGARAATEEWLLFLDDDDRFAENKCERLAEEINKHPDINFIYHPAKCEMVNEGFTYVTKPILPQEISVERILLANKIGGMPMVVVKKDLFLKIGGLSTALRSLEDYDFLLKLVKDPTFKPHRVDELLTHCTFHTKRSSVSTDTTNTEKAIDYIREHYVETEKQAHNFNINASYILAYPHIMNLSRKAAYYYFDIFKQTKSIKQLVIAMIVLISPELALNLKRFM